MPIERQPPHTHTHTHTHTHKHTQDTHQHCGLFTARQTVVYCHLLYTYPPAVSSGNPQLLQSPLAEDGVLQLEMVRPLARDRRPRVVLRPRLRVNQRLKEVVAQKREERLDPLGVVERRRCLFSGGKEAEGVRVSKR